MRVPADLITGFLGSGKTTLLRHVLRHGLGGQRVAVVVNDLADIGVDGRVLASDDLPAVEALVELDSGCICCSVDLRFSYALQDLVERLEPDLVLIEATGIADPRLLIDRIGDSMLALDAVITVVDAENFDRALAASSVAAAQVSAADFLVLNKVDLVTAAEVERLDGRLAVFNPRALRLRAAFARVETPLLFGSSVRAYRRRGAAAPADEHGFESFTCETGAPLSRDRFESFLQELPSELYRAKGIVQFAGESLPSLFNFTCGRVHFQWLPGGRGSGGEGVFIGRRALQHRAEVERGFRSCRAT